MVGDRALVFRAVLFLAFLHYAGTTTAASPGFHQLGACDAAAAEASHRTGVPLKILKAVTRTETGRSRNGQIAPWPWTINVEGKGFWLGSKSEATDFVQKSLNSGKTLVDVGCFQINIHWHGEQFLSVDDMLDPTRNAVYAARFLKQLFDETGNWKQAVGKFHSRTPAHANRYLERFNRIFAALPGRRSSFPLLSQERKNSFPLLKPSGGASAIGSLVPGNLGAPIGLFTTRGN